MLTVYELHDLLASVTDTPPDIEAVRAWTEQQRIAAFRWAAREYTARHNQAIFPRIEKPEFI